MNNPTAKEVTAVIQVVAALAESIRELGSVPSGVLYANVCGHLSMSMYERVIQTLKNAGLVSESGHVLTWIGGDIKKA